MVLVILVSCNKATWNLKSLPEFRKVVLLENNQSYTRISVSFKPKAQKDTKFGFCVADHDNPTIDDEVYYVDAKNLSYALNLPWNSFTNKYVRAFAINSLGICYSPNCLSIFWPANIDNIPEIHLNSIDSISFHFVDATATITNTGNLPIVEKGFIISMDSTPLISNSIICKSSSLNLNFIKRNYGLSDNTTYFVRAFVTNTYQTALSFEIMSVHTPNFYQLGEIGPAGGKIFYIDTTGAYNWHFLEAAPNDYITTLKWSINSNYINGLLTNVGSGSMNTQLIYANQGGTGVYAAALAAYYIQLNGYNWFLPSRDELLSLIQADANIGGFNLVANNEYWSSSQDENFNQNAWVVKYTPEPSSYSLNKITSKSVRYIRKF